MRLQLALNVSTSFRMHSIARSRYLLPPPAAGDWMLRSDDRLPDLLHAGVRVLIYAGDQDLSCNWVGNRRWVDALEWDGHTAWAETLD